MHRQSVHVKASSQEPVCTGLHHVALRVRQPDRAARLYTAAAGCQGWPAGQDLGLGAGSVPLCAPNAGLVLLASAGDEPPAHRPVSEAGIAHLCLQTPAIATVVARLRAAGATLHSEPIDLGTGFLYCYVRDPEHNVIELECVAPVWPDPRPWIAHANIVTHDLRRLSTFYAAWLGVQAVRSPRLGNDARLDAIAALPGVQLRAAWLDAGNAQIELMQYLQPATGPVSGRRAAGAPGFAHLAFEVCDLDRACAHLQACGGQVDNPREPGAWQAWASDPDGNRLLLLDLHAPCHAALRIQALAAPHITQRFAAARAALLASE